MKELALHILDIAENSVSAGASKVGLSISQDEGVLTLCITDNGKGMSNDELNRVADPFYTSRTTRKVGLGIPLLKQHAEMTGGSFSLESVSGKGTMISARFTTGNVDVQPIGDVAGCFLILAASYPDIEFLLNCSSLLGDFSLSSFEIIEEIGLKELQSGALRKELKRMIQNNMEKLEICYQMNEK